MSCILINSTISNGQDEKQNPEDFMFLQFISNHAIFSILRILPVFTCTISKLENCMFFVWFVLCLTDKGKCLYSINRIEELSFTCQERHEQYYLKVKYFHVHLAVFNFA